MDADVQNDPADIPRLLAKMREGYDVIVGWRQDRHDNLGRRVLSRSANWLTRKVTGLYLHDYACALKAFKKKYMVGIHLYGEMHVFLAAILQSRGARVAEIPVTHHKRHAGVSKHFFMKAVKDIADLLTIKFLFTYAARPLVFFGGWALASIGIGVFSGLAAIALKIAELRNFGQTPLPIITALFIILGVILFMMGFIAELMLRIYYEGRKETPYTISEVIENEGSI
ncbi:MAG: Glycosyl transferase, family 2 [Parcubacteria group bacterium GW2011_GWC2_52_8c]|nr:MAG: Glycosyl transferase, family 2 [Parcubacteria group bacterium GW2011_GWC2_52_8c]